MSEREERRGWRRELNEVMEEWKADMQETFRQIHHQMASDARQRREAEDQRRKQWAEERIQDLERRVQSVEDDVTRLFYALDA